MAAASESTSASSWSGRRRRYRLTAGDDPAMSAAWSSRSASCRRSRGCGMDSRTLPLPQPPMTDCLVMSSLARLLHGLTHVASTAASRVLTPAVSQGDSSKYD